MGHDQYLKISITLVIALNMNNMICMITMAGKNSNKCYGSTKVGARGQIVLPIELREKLDIRKGELLFVVENNACIRIMRSDVLNKLLEGVED